MTYYLCLSNQIQCPMLDKLQNVWYPIRTVKVNISLLLINKGLIAHWFEIFPCLDKVLYHANVRFCLYIKISGIKETADI